MDQAAVEAGDRLKDIIDRAIMALMDGDESKLWRILDQESVEAVEQWDRLCGREAAPRMPEEDRQRFTDLLRSSLRDK